MSETQPGILVAPPAVGRYLFFSIIPGTDIVAPLRAATDTINGDSAVLGLGPSLALALGRPIEGLVVAPHYAGAAVEVPSTSAALWLWLRGEDRGDLVHQTLALEQALAGGFRLDHVVDGFRYGPSRDLTGYEDGTENPKGAKAYEAAVVQGRGPGLDGSSFVAVQQWLHDFAAFEKMSPDEQDAMMGRRKSDNEELADAPPSAHVKRANQESFEPKAFVLRRSMPWAEGGRAGLMFVAFGKSFAAFDVQLKRMVGADDGIVDALFKFTRPVSGAYFWCPPMQAGRIDLRAVGTAD